MNVLDFERTMLVQSGKRVRRACFTQRSSLPVSAACLVANGVRESLSAVLGAPVSLRLFEPVLPDADGWAAIASDAKVWRLQGSVADAALVLRPLDAVALVGAVFAEAPDARRTISPIEERVVKRALRALGGTLAPVCGSANAGSLCTPTNLRGFTTYFELLIEAPASLRIGIALSRDPENGVAPSFRTGQLAAINIDLRVQVGCGTFHAARLLQLRCGDTIELQTRIDGPSLLYAQKQVVARGECGVLRGRRVLALT